MKITLTSLLLFFATNTLFSQGISLPYYTGFDSPTEQAGWQQYRTGFLSNYDWNNNGAISHDYNVGGNSTDTVIDWYVSPPLNFIATGEVTMKVFTGGFSTPTPDNCELWFGTNDPNPLTGNFVLIATLSYMQPQYQWLDTTVNIPFTSDSGYIAFKYKTIGAEWMTYSIDSITVNSTVVGINKLEPTHNVIAKVVPNPCISMTTIYFDSKVQNGQLSVYNMDGQMVKSITNVTGVEYQLFRDELPAGIYTLRLLENNTTISTAKIIITD